MSHYPCPDCCGGSVACYVYLTGFLYPDTTTVQDATELAGDWEVASFTLEPDHADSDQRIRFDATSTDPDVVVVCGVQGSNGDQVGACLFLDADGDSYVEGTILFGSGTAGRLHLRRYTNGVLTWTVDVATSPACGTNEYDLPGGVTYKIALSHRAVDGGSIWRLSCYSADVTAAVGSGQGDLGTVEYFDSAGAGVSTFEAGLVTGTDAITATFTEFEFMHIYAPCVCYIVFDYPSKRAAPCDYVGADYIEEEGDWDLETIEGFSQIVTYDFPATLLVRDELRSPVAHTAFFGFGTPGAGGFSGDIEPVTFRWFWDWVDDDNYWCVEYEFGDVSVVDCDDAIRVIERSAGVETVHEERTGMGNRQGAYAVGAVAMGSVQVMANGYVAADFMDWCDPDCFLGLVCSGPHTFTGTGRTGFKVVDAPTGWYLSWLWLRDGVSSCIVEYTCTTCDEPVVTPDPDPPADSCCLEELQLGDELNVNLANVQIDIDCAADPCIVAETWWTDLGATTFTVEVVEITDNVVIAEGDTGIGNPCITGTGSWWVRVYIQKGGPDTCIVTVALYWEGDTPHAECTLYWQSDGIAAGDACAASAFFYTGANVDPFCCLDPDGTSTASVSIP